VNKKLTMKWKGPYRIRTDLGQNTYLLEEAESGKIIEPVHSGMLKKYRGPAIERKQTLIQGEEYEVEAIRAWRKGKETTEYLIEWVGWKDWTWEKETHLSCDEEKIRFVRNAWNCTCGSFGTTQRDLRREHERTHHSTENTSREITG